MNLKFYTSYFYKVRFLKPYMIPFSTAVWDPKWFHDNKGSYNIFKDKNNVYNGLRLQMLQPQNHDCSGPKECRQNPENCSFKEKYFEQLESINFEDFISYCTDIAYQIKDNENFSEDPEIVLLVYETPDNPCSEREAIKKWFRKNNYPIEELKVKK